MEMFGSFWKLSKLGFAEYHLEVCWGREIRVLNNLMVANGHMDLTSYSLIYQV